MVDASKIKNAPQTVFKKGELEQPIDVPLYEIDGIAGVMASSSLIRFSLYQGIPRYPFKKGDINQIKRICCTLSMTVEEFVAIYYWMGSVIEDYKKQDIIT